MLIVQKEKHLKSNVNVLFLFSTNSLADKFNTATQNNYIQTQSHLTENAMLLPQLDHVNMRRYSIVK